MIARILILVLSLATLPLPAAAQQIGPNGLHVQPWIDNSETDLRKVLKQAAAEGRDLLVLVEQDGCIYCKKLHEVNFAKPALVRTITQNFRVIQLDMWGAREMTDLDGTVLSEKDLVARWNATTTPTTIVLSADDPEAGSREAAEAFRLPGYLPAFQYNTVLTYFAGRHYNEMSFREYMAQQTAALAEKGLTPETW